MKQDKIEVGSCVKVLHGELSGKFIRYLMFQIKAILLQ